MYLFWIAVHIWKMKIYRIGCRVYNVFCFSVELVSLQSCSLTPNNWRTLSIVHYNKMSQHIIKNGLDNELSQHIPKTQMAVVVHGQGLPIDDTPRIPRHHKYGPLVQRTTDTRRSLCLRRALMRSLSRSRLLESAPAMPKLMQEQRDSGVSQHSEKNLRF